MRRAALLCLALIFGGPAAQAQDATPPSGEGAPFIGQPRALALYQDVAGYDDLLGERYGSPAQPVQNELGLRMLVRMLHNVCLGVERGRALEDVVPPGYAIYPGFEYSIAENPAPDPTAAAVALSPTGSIDTDEAQGHPYMFLTPNSRGADCLLIWVFDGSASQDRHLHMAIALHTLPADILGLVPATSTQLNPDGFFGNVLSYDRYCGGSWCRFSTTYVLTEGELSFSTVLNITDIPRRVQ